MKKKITRQKSTKVTIGITGSLNIYIYIVDVQYGEGTGNPLQYSCLENPMDRGA